VHFRNQELDRAEHHDHQAEGGELGEKADEHAEAAGGFGDREDAEFREHAGGQLRGRLHAPQFALAESVREEDGAEADAKHEQGEVGELVQ